MRECLLSCVEQALYDKSVEKRLGQLGTELQAMGRQVSLRSSLLEKSNAKRVRDRVTLRLRIKGFGRRHGDHCCC
jgi:hypothetical protein